MKIERESFRSDAGDLRANIMEKLGSVFVGDSLSDAMATASAEEDAKATYIAGLLELQ